MLTGCALDVLVKNQIREEEVPGKVRRRALAGITLSVLSSSKRNSISWPHDCVIRRAEDETSDPLAIWLWSALGHRSSDV